MGGKQLCTEFAARMSCGELSTMVIAIIFLFTHATLPTHHDKQLLNSSFYINKTQPEIISDIAAFVVWLRVLQLSIGVSHHEFVTKLIMQ